MLLTEHRTMPVNGKPRKKDFTDMHEFMRAAAAWANQNMVEWPWGGPKDEDDEYYFVETAKARRRNSMSEKLEGFDVYREGSLWIAVGPDHLVDTSCCLRGISPQSAEEAISLLMSFDRARYVWPFPFPTAADFKIHDTPMPRT